MLLKSLTAGFALATAITAQQIDTTGLTACAIKCLNQAISQVPCGATDQSCICTAQDNNLPDLISNCGIAAGCAVDAASAGANIGNYCFSFDYPGLTAPPLATGSPQTAGTATATNALATSAATTKTGSTTAATKTASTAPASGNGAGSVLGGAADALQMVVPLVLVVAGGVFMA